MRFYFLFILAAHLFLFSGNASANETLRISLADNQSAVVLKTVSGHLLWGKSGSGREKTLSFTPADVDQQPIQVRSTGPYIRMNGKSYRGAIEVRKKQNGLLLVINELDIEEYLKGVVAAEIPHDWEFEAIKAQAIAARTYALYQKRTAGSRPYHILATVDSQVYDGKRGERPSALRAIRETEGLVLTYQGEVIPAFYHSSCGGHTENAMELWGLDAYYLRGVDCECQKISRYGEWEKRIDVHAASTALARQGYKLTGVQDVSINGVTPAGRVKQVEIRHVGGIASIPAEKFRAAIGYSSIPSVFFEIELAGPEIVISGRGMGHGVGLCQWGAREMAQRGIDFRTILYYYYPGVRLEKIKHF